MKTENTTERANGGTPLAEPTCSATIPDWQIVTILPHGYIDVDCNSGNRRTVINDDEPNMEGQTRGGSRVV